MLASQRHTMILELLEKEGTVHTADLVKRMEVSSETIRKDLDYLEQSGQLVRVHGGAVPAPSGSIPEIPEEYISFQIRNSQHLEQKVAITKYAASLVQEGQVVALDYGSTSQIMALALKERFHKLTIITNSLQNTLLLSDSPGFTIILTGGVLNKDEFTLVDDFTPLLDHLHIDVLFMTVTGIDPVIGCTDQRLSEAKLQRQMSRNASRTIVMADSSKFGRASLAKICPIRDVNMVITDSGVSEEMKQAFREIGTELVVV